MSAMKEEMTSEEVASYLRISMTTVYRLIKAKKLATTRNGHGHRVSKEDLETFMLSNRRKSYVREALAQLPNHPKKA